MNPRARRVEPAHPASAVPTPDDPRIAATARLIERELAVDGLVYRYLERDDGLPGGEGAFLICTWWLVDNLALIGDIPWARDLFERTLGYANDLGLMAEQVDPASGELLGNFPQAFSHIGLIGAAMNLWKATARTSEDVEPSSTGVA